MFEKQPSWPQEHLIGIECRGSIKQWISSIKRVAKWRIVFLEQDMNLIEDILGESRIIDDQSSYEIVQSWILSLSC